MSRFVVVGAGLAAAKAVEALRERGYDGQLVVYGAEPHLPYERPPLSKDQLLGTAEPDQATVHPAEWYDEHQVELRLNTPAVALDLAHRTVGDGSSTERYDRLLIATGSSPRRLPLADGSGAPVAYLRTLEDSARIKAMLEPGRRIVVIGGGWIGLEVAAAARNADADVTVVETLDLPLLRVLGPEVAAVLARVHQAHGVDLRTGASVTAIEPDGDGAVVRLGDGSSVHADLVLVGIGAGPNVELAEAAGLHTDNGIVVDEHLRTEDPHVFAAGDVASAYHPLLGRHLRVEHWDNAIEQGVAAARNMLGEDHPYDRMPYFFSDQYDVGMEYVGHAGPGDYDEVLLRGEPDKAQFTALYVTGDRVLAGMHANDWDAIDPIRALVGSSVPADRLRDTSVSLADLAP